MVFPQDICVSLVGCFTVYKCHGYFLLRSVKASCGFLELSIAISRERERESRFNWWYSCNVLSSISPLTEKWSMERPGIRWYSSKPSSTTGSTFSGSGASISPWQRNDDVLCLWSKFITYLSQSASSFYLIPFKIASGRAWSCLLVSISSIDG